MKLNTQNQQKIEVKRASLWAGVYHSTAQQNALRGQTLFVPDKQADLALNEFDKRFPIEPVCQAKK